MFTAGNPGRPVGSKNKAGLALKDAILNAFTEVGGKKYLVTVARDDPKTFCALLAKLMPQELKAEVTVNGGLADLMAQARERVARGVAQ